MILHETTTDAQQRRSLLSDASVTSICWSFRVEARCVGVQRSGAEGTLDDNRAALGTKTASMGPVMLLACSDR
ncbi:hypothetical protein TNCT_181321 [Trichonephila clavata]|uniref:Uncharacterized protein n=1 Tax=Trichonephila clavata TaxID=2740835 RepID=A0A8X6I4E5_TRICU|nr:hypothetical protein TNCT_181321 [Trichonephila clavata]